MAIEGKCPYLKSMWVKHRDDLAFNKFAQTLMRFGIVKSMVMINDYDRIFYSVDEWGEYGGEFYDEHDHVSVIVVVDDKEEIYEVYEDWY